MPLEIRDDQRQASKALTPSNPPKLNKKPLSTGSFRSARVINCCEKLGQCMSGNKGLRQKLANDPQAGLFDSLEMLVI